MIQQMIVNIEDLPEVRLKHYNEKIVLAGGVFDLLHPGHIDLFKRVRQMGDVAVIALSTDKRVKERKGPSRPILDELTRLTLVDSVKYVDYALLAPEPDPAKEVPTLQVIESLRPDAFMTSESSWLRFEEKVADYGTKLILIPRLNETISTTHTINKILETYPAGM